MGILRKDYILDRWVYFATSRKKRPHEYKKDASIVRPKVCLFCPHNEKLTPPEIGRVEYKNSWKIRWFLNKFPAVDLSGNSKSRKRGNLIEADSYGIHEIIAETNHHRSQMSDLPVEHIRDILEVYKIRIKYLSEKKDIKYVQVFKNHGKDAGTSLVHSHSQVVGLNMVPQTVTDECLACSKSKRCPYCKIVKQESKSKRKIFETQNVIAFAPYASRFNYEAWVFLKRHKRTLEELTDSELYDLAKALKLILVKLKKINASYNFYLHYSPDKKDLHLHFEITPRIATWAGFEISTNFIINSVLPEDAAKFYRGK
jgi:UDPglucose--hexose-1-phosphate uridylyltransferase